MKKRLTEYIKYSLLRYSVGVIFFTFFCFIAYEHALRKIRLERELLAAQVAELQQEKLVALKEHEALLLQLNSESDPQWIELVLMKKLGVVPEDYIKVFFKKND